jgi:antitoxin (DNA-binding transcriptional repressor) of toxin-antitoxin stability system
MEATMHQAKTQLSKLVKAAIFGEEVVLTRGQKRIPVARIVPIDSASPLGEISAAEALKKGERPLGLYKGQFEIGPEFFEPLPEEELALWEHGENDDQLFGPA